jgi:Rha family phage regulatory protein
MRAIYDPNLGLGWDKKGQPVADSRRVAAQFDKRHADVLRDKEALNAKLRSASRDPADYFQPQFYRDPTGRQLPYFEMSRKGFDHLVLSFAGDAAFPVKADYIDAWHEMERLLRRGGSPVEYQAILDKLDELQTVRLGLRVNMSAATQRAHIAEVARQGGVCPLCRRVAIVHRGQIIVIGGRKAAEFDHHYHVGKAALTTTWLICAVGKESCHYNLTNNLMRRDQADAAFRHYQQLLADRQRSLFCSECPR